MAKPTGRQLSYLRSLADRTGQTFTYPKTFAQASAEIDRLKHTRPQSQTERRVERKLIADQVATGLHNTRVAEDEITGYGSDASWVHNRQAPKRISSSHRRAARRAGPTAGKRVELGRYRTPAGERVLYGQRVDGKVRITDRPAGKVTTTNRAFLIEPGLSSKAELDAIVADYLAQAKALQAVLGAAMPIDRILAELAA